MKFSVALQKFRSCCPLCRDDILRWFSSPHLPSMSEAHCFCLRKRASVVPRRRGRSSSV